MGSKAIAGRLNVKVSTHSSTFTAVDRVGSLFFDARGYLCDVLLVLLQFTEKDRGALTSIVIHVSTTALLKSRAVNMKAVDRAAGHLTDCR